VVVNLGPAERQFDVGASAVLLATGDVTLDNDGLTVSGETAAVVRTGD
jgi:hypothetical protein